LQTETVATAAGTGIATIIYTPPTYIVGTTASTCTITAKDGDYGQTGTAVIEQTEPPNTQALTPAAASLPANGSATDLLTDVVTSPVTVPGEADSDAVTFSELGTCGTLSSSGGNTTPADVAVTTTYTASSTPGFCEIIATELNSGVVTMASLDQTQSPTPTPGTVTWSPAAGSQTVGTSVAYTVTVKDHLGDVVVGDPVAFSVTTVPPAGETCGTLSTPITSTGSSGIATVIYTASSATLTTVPDASCTVIGAEADSTAFAALTILQNPVPPVVTLTQALPGNNDPLGVADAISLSMSNVAFATDNGDAIAWTVTSISGICGTVSGASTTLTVASGATTGTAAASYTAPSNSGFCTITATVTRPGPVLVPGSTTVDQT
jgi:hypothetical protein